MQWVRFVDRMPTTRDPNRLLCSHAGRDPFMYHWRIDSGGHTEDADFMWCEGLRYPPVPSIAELNQRKSIATAA